MAEFRRRRIIVDKEIQGRYLRKTALMPVLGIATGSIAVAILAVRVVTEAQEAATPLPSLLPLLLAIGLLVLCTCGLILLESLRFGHRVAGPLYRIRRLIQEMREGKLDQQLKLRHGDELNEIAEELNDYIRSLREQQTADPTASTPEPSAERVPVANETPQTSTVD